MSDTYVYRIGDNLYINLTNECSNRCAFCVRDQSAEYEGYSLWLDREPEPRTVNERLSAELEKAKARGEQIEEVVFCGYGEPTCRADAMKSVAEFAKAHGCKTRLNTNGHGNLINGRNVVPEWKGLIDAVNISLNAPDAESYAKLCRPRVEGAFEGMIRFARECRAAGIDCWFSVVDCIGSEAAARCRALAQEVGIPLRVREMIENKT